MRVLIADDSAAVANRLAELLAEEVPGAQLIGLARNVSEAISGVQSTSPDVLILDLQMPDGSGLAVLRAVRRGHPRLQVLVCTNYPAPKYREECLNSGANFFLDKSKEFELIPGILLGLIKEYERIASSAL